MIRELFWAELYKILRRRVVWLWLAALGGMMCFWVWASTLAEADTVVQGVRLRGREAIEKDREIARQWEGTLTIEKLYRILDTYGIAVNEEADINSERGGNWVSRYATDELTDYKSRKDFRSAAVIDRESLDRLRERLERTTPYFCYMEGMHTLYEIQYSMNLLLLVILALALAPVFAEESQCLMTPLLLTAEGGGRKTALSKLLAAAVFSEGLYVCADGLLLAWFLWLYGTDGLRASACLCGWAVENAAEYSMGQAYLISFFWGMAGVLLLCVLTLFFSARYRKTFLALFYALVCLAGPMALVLAVSRIIPFFLLRIACMAAGVCSPYFFMLYVESEELLAWLPGMEAVRAVAVGFLIVYCCTGIVRLWRQSGT